ncbi:MAG: NADP-dependent malic enzyme [Bdellovibrionaceae bacterium]|nr:NADP-dependent malic enzyme [Pseudobdellovibrionaceae bacterium]
MKNVDKEALEYHTKGSPGKIEVVASKEVGTEYALSLAYSPGVAAPCKEIAKNPEDVYKYTIRGNLVAVVTNGTAVLGLGDIGPLAGKPVMEGKGILFKQFANINVFDIELNTKTNEEFIAAVKALEPTFGGINLEDIKAPECFEIEERLKEEMSIPVFHDDQHGTAIITAAAFINGCHLTGRKLADARVVFNGAGAAAIACAKLLISMGAQAKNVLLCDSKGVIRKGRTDGMNSYKEEFAVETERKTLAEALEGADCFIGLSVAGAVTPEMLTSMAKNPLVFAMANPVPEIDPHKAKKVRPDVIVATGRSDYPNQVNNVLGFPSIFRGALDVQATTINEEMKIAAVNALAELARQDVPESVSAAYSNQAFHYGPEYIIPKPFDSRVLIHVAPAVARAAMDSGVAKRPIQDFKKYIEELEGMQSYRRGFIRSHINQVKNNARRKQEAVPLIVFPEGRSSKILKALQSVHQERVIRPVLLGYEDAVHARMDELELSDLKGIEIWQPAKHPRFSEYVEKFYDKRKRKGVMLAEAERLMSDPYYFSAMAVAEGDADGLVSGATHPYSECVRPILELIGTGRRRTASGLNIVLWQDRILLFADTTINIDPTSEQLANIAVHAAQVAKFFKIDPKIAMLSYTNFTAEKESPKKMRRAAELVRERYPRLIVDGEMQADTAVNPQIMERIFPFGDIKGGANVLVFPNLDAGNIGYKLVQQLGGGEVLGPFIMGLKKAANVLQRTCSVDDVVNTIVMTAVEAQVLKE